MPVLFLFTVLSSSGAGGAGGAGSSKSTTVAATAIATEQEEPAAGAAGAKRSQQKQEEQEEPEGHCSFFPELVGLPHFPRRSFANMAHALVPTQSIVPAARFTQDNLANWDAKHRVGKPCTHTHLSNMRREIHASG